MKNVLTVCDFFLLDFFFYLFTTPSVLFLRIIPFLEQFSTLLEYFQEAGRFG